MIKRAILALSLLLSLLSSPARAAGCFTVMLPDLGPATERPLTTGIVTGFPVPAGWTQPTGAFYAFNLYSSLDGHVGIEQLGAAAAEHPHRDYYHITSIALVSWLSFHDEADAPLTYTGYTTLVNSLTIGPILPTWAYRVTERFNRTLDYTPMSTPIQLGQQWSVSILNPHDRWVIANLQVRAMLCN